MGGYSFYGPGDSFGKYLKKIGQFSVLSKAEEYELGVMIQRLVAAESELRKKSCLKTLEQKAKYLGLTPNEYRKLVLEGKEAKQKLINHNIRFVVHVAKRYCNRGVDMQDLVQEGTLGLHRAVEKFDPELGYKFSTYACWWIRQAITKSISVNSKPVKLPLEMFTLLNKVKRTARHLSQQWGYSPSLSEVAAYLEKDLDKIQRVVLSSKQALSIETHLYRSDIPDEQCDDGEDGLSAFGLSEGNLIEIFACLNRREQYIIIRKFGLNGEKPTTYRQIARDVGRSTEWVRQVRDEAFAKIRQAYELTVV